MVLPILAARRIRLRRDAGSGSRRHGVAGQSAQSHDVRNRNGFFYVLDRTTGQFLLGKPFVEVNWASGLDEKGGRSTLPEWRRRAKV